MSLNPKTVDNLDFKNSQPAEENGNKPSSVVTRTIAPDFLVIRGTSSPERIVGTNIDEVRTSVTRQIRSNSGTVKQIAVYQLVHVEVFEASSKTLSPDEYKSMLAEQTRVGAELQQAGE